MAAYELLVFGYFSALILVAWVGPTPRKRRWQATLLGAAVVSALLAVTTIGSTALRAWIPVAFLVAGYWMPALLTQPAGETFFETWLHRTDAAVRPWLPTVPSALISFLELAYLFCYPLVPLTFSVVWLKGTSSDIERFWLAVLTAGYACYITLPWLISRPPRARQTRTSQGAIRRVNERVLSRCSHQLNTFPSGHVAVTAAAALAMGAVSVQAGLAAGAIVGAIAVGAAAARYHYVVDVILGLVVAGAAVTLAGIL